MNLFCIEQLLITISCVSLAIFIAKHAENTTHRIWAIVNCAVAGWAFWSIFAGLSKSADQATFYWRLSYASGMFISMFFYHFVCSYFKLKRKYILRILYIETTICALFYIFYKPFVTTKFLFNSIHYITSNPLCEIAVDCWWIITFIAFVEFFKHIKDDSSLQKPSLIMFLAWLIGFSGGTSTFLPYYGIMVYPAWQVFICVYAGITTYVIFYHRLLPVNVVLKRSIIYSLLAALISLTYLASVLISQRLFHQYFGYSSTILGSIIIAIIFIPLKDRIQSFVDQSFFKATPLEIANQNEKLKAVAVLASGLAHEIKNPLTTLKTFAEFVPQKKNDPQFMEQYQRIMPQEITRIDNLVHELLYFAKPCPPHMEAVNPNETIRNLLLLLEQKFESSNIKIIPQLEATQNIQADPNQLKQVLLNLILNAIDAMPHGGTLTISTSVIPSSTVIPAQAGIFKIAITDTGHGIDPKDLPHIFEPFFTKKDKGTGLGLAITKEIIEKHGGKITVQSKLNQGTTFSIELPITP